MPVVEHNHHLPTRRRPLHRLTVIIWLPRPLTSLSSAQNYSIPPVPRWITSFSVSADASARAGNVVFMRKQAASWLICTNCPHVGCPNRRCTGGVKRRAGADEKPAAEAVIQLLFFWKTGRSCTRSQTDLQMRRRYSHIKQPNWYYAGAQESILFLKKSFLCEMWELRLRGRGEIWCLCVGVQDGVFVKGQRVPAQTSAGLSDNRGAGLMVLHPSPPAWLPDWAHQTVTGSAWQFTNVTAAVSPAGQISQTKTAP